MKLDEFILAVKNDSLILAYGSKLYTKHGHEKHLKVQYLSQKIRELARFLTCVCQIDTTIQKLSDCIQANKFLMVVAVIRKLCGFDEHSHKYENPHLAMKIGHNLNNCANISLCETVAREQRVTKEETTAFETLYKKCWESEISNHALETIR